MYMYKYIYKHEYNCKHAHPRHPHIRTHARMHTRIRTNTNSHWHTQTHTHTHTHNLFICLSPLFLSLSPPPTRTHTHDALTHACTRTGNHNHTTGSAAWQEHAAIETNRCFHRRPPFFRSVLAAIINASVVLRLQDFHTNFLFRVFWYWWQVLNLDQ